VESRSGELGLPACDSSWGDFPSADGFFDREKTPCKSSSLYVEFVSTALPPDARTPIRGR